MVLVLLLFNLPLAVLSSIFMSFLEQARLWMMTAHSSVAPLTTPAIASNLLRPVLWALPIIVAIHSWPIGLAALTRCLRWPQFVRPLALTLAAFALRPLYLLTGLVAGALLSGGWSGLIYESLFLLDPVNLAILVFGLYVSRAAWRADREFRKLVPDTARKAPLHRAIFGGSTLTASVIFAALLACYFIWAGYLIANHFRLPTELNRRTAQAMAEFKSGVALLRLNPAKAEDHFRKALPLWERLVQDVPSELNYQITLEVVRTDLAIAAFAQARLAEASEQLKRSAAQWEALASSPIPASQRALVDRHRNLVRTTLGSIDFALNVAQGQTLKRAGDLAGAEAAYRRALESTQSLKGGSSRTPALEVLRNKNEAAALNDLAWLFSISPGTDPQQTREAVTLADRACTLEPDNANYRKTLSLAHYRVKDWPGASSEIEHSMRLRGGGDANDWVILAMIRWQQGAKVEARRWYDEAATEIKRQGRADNDLLRLRDEASALLEISPAVP